MPPTLLRHSTTIRSQRRFVMHSGENPAIRFWPMLCAGPLVHPATNTVPWRNDNRTMDDGTSDNNGTHADNGATCADAACAVHTTRAYDGTRFHGAQGNKASCQQ